jgi:hypothetical protein
MGCATSRNLPPPVKAKSHPIWDRFQRVQMLGQGASASVFLVQNLKPKVDTESVLHRLDALCVDKCDVFRPENRCGVH